MPTSLLASITETSAVSERMASKTSSTDTRPYPSTGRTVSWIVPCRSMAYRVFSTEGCSTAEVITWLPRSRLAATPPQQEVVPLAAAGGEDDLIFVSINAPSHLDPGLLKRLSGRSGVAVEGGRVPLLSLQ